MPNDYQLIADTEKAQAIWYYYLILARSRPGLFLLDANASVQSLNGNAAKETAFFRRSHIAELLRQQSEARFKQAKTKPKTNFVSVSNDNYLVFGHLTSISSDLSSLPSSYRSLTLFNFPNSSSSTKNNSDLSSDFKSDRPFSSFPDNKMASKNGSFLNFTNPSSLVSDIPHVDPLQISKNEPSFIFKIRLSERNLEFDFANQLECQNFCSRITPSIIIPEKDKESKSKSSFSETERREMPLLKEIQN